MLLTRVLMNSAVKTIKTLLESSFVGQYDKNYRTQKMSGKIYHPKRIQTVSAIIAYSYVYNKNLFVIIIIL